MMRWRACPKYRCGGARRYHAFIFQKRVLFIRDGRISLVQASLELADAASQALKLRRMLLFNTRRDRTWAGLANRKLRRRYAAVDPSI
jgi:hypothetical protein